MEGIPGGSRSIVMKREGALAPKILTFEDIMCDMKADFT
jgi:hypothetical protein